MLVFGFQERYCEMRVSLNQKPNSSKDFGFQAAWDSTGARVTSIQPGNNRRKHLQTNRRALFTFQYHVCCSADLHSQRLNPPITEVILETSAQAVLYFAASYCWLAVSRVPTPLQWRCQTLCRAASNWVRSAGPEPLSAQSLPTFTVSIS